MALGLIQFAIGLFGKCGRGRNVIISVPILIHPVQSLLFSTFAFGVNYSPDLTASDSVVIVFELLL